MCGITHITQWRSTCHHSPASGWAGGSWLEAPSSTASHPPTPHTETSTPPGVTFSPRSQALTSVLSPLDTTHSLKHGQSCCEPVLASAAAVNHPAKQTPGPDFCETGVVWKLLHTRLLRQATAWLMQPWAPADSVLTCDCEGLG